MGAHRALSHVQILAQMSPHLNGQYIVSEINDLHAEVSSCYLFTAGSLGTFNDTVNMGVINWGSPLK